MTINQFQVCYVQLPAAFSLPKTSWIIQRLTHKRTTRVETDGEDKDSTDNSGKIHSTQQPEDPSQYTVCLLAVLDCCCITGHFKDSKEFSYPCQKESYPLHFTKITNSSTFISKESQ